MDQERFRREVDRAVQVGAQTLRDDTKRMPPVSAKTSGFAALGIPVDTGRMRQAVQARKLGEEMAEVYADTNYSAHVHDGTGKIPPRPFFTWVLKDFGGLEKVDALLRAAMERVVNP